MRNVDTINSQFNIKALITKDLTNQYVTGKIR